ncbi:hypothetical protein AHMF7605_11535 [Adhaeribacter arboris]|uniref:ABC3 transporter permease C-terminal domain-containing protein n=1 Tax=Adhaeribacter arboris TaxID=2072846 RepID=A0A2T2YF27_9BACT|nr:FtsX-like permease family protein [Adhaeribacter arboris]PSR54104.1 hypothetical protein AHMF7605_11535 [Adhaeribacter arboris]
MDSTRLATFKNSLLADGSVYSVSASSSIPSANIPINQVNDGSSNLSQAQSMQMLFTDLDFIRTMKMKIVAGRDFSEKMALDKTEGFLINEEAVKKLGYQKSEAAIGTTIQWVQPNTVLKKGKVVGVVQNFNITPLKTTVQPLVLHYFPNRLQYLYLRFNQKNADQVLKEVAKKFTSLAPKQSLEYTFLDDTLNAMYTSETKLGVIFSYFSFLAIFIACLGILGLSLYTIQLRIKEIAIRKVLGATVLSITAELLKQFIKPVLLASLLATPITWYVMSKWLEEFAYRTPILPSVFVITTALVLALAVLTMTFQSVKAALSNPVLNLRSE